MKNTSFFVASARVFVRLEGCKLCFEATRSLRGCRLPGQSPCLRCKLAFWGAVLILPYVVQRGKNTVKNCVLIVLFFSLLIASFFWSLCSLILLHELNVWFFSSGCLSLFYVISCFVSFFLYLFSFCRSFCFSLLVFASFFRSFFLHFFLRVEGCPKTFGSGESGLL